MNQWLKYAVEFGVGFLDGYVQSQVERRDRLTFVDAMLRLCRETGYRVEFVDSITAVFEIPAGGESRSVVVVERGEFAVINAMSSIMFPSGQAPSDVCRLLQVQNRQLARCDFDLYTGRDGDHFFVKTSVRRSVLTSATFEAATQEVVSHVVDLDRMLVRSGYVD
jgi:hypothetical protein